LALLLPPPPLLLGMHRFALSGGRTALLRHAVMPQPALMARNVSNTAALAAEASAAAAAAPAPAAAAAAAVPNSSRITEAAASIFNANYRGRSSSASFVRFAPPKAEVATGKRHGQKKVRQRAPYKNVAPLLTRLWGRNGNFKTLAPEDWANIVLNNRRRLLQMKEKDQYRAWVRFQRLKRARLAWLREQGEEVSAEMRARIEKREKEIIAMTVAARKKLDAPVPPLPLPDKPQSDKAAAASARAKHNPQTYLRTQYNSDVWRVFTFRLTHYHSHVLHRQQEKFRELAQRLGLSPSRPTYLPHRMKKMNIIRSPHVDKTSREQYETRLYSLQIHISPSVDKFYAVQRLCELTFRLINGNVRMRVETPPNLPIESVVFAPHPLKAENGHVPHQQYAVRDSPGIESILYKFDQHQFPFLVDWEEEILDDKFRGIYPPERDALKPYPLPFEDEMGLKLPETLALEKEQAASIEQADAEGKSDVEEEGKTDADAGVFDEEGSFGLGEAEFEEDEAADAMVNAADAAHFDIDDERDDMQRLEDLYESRVEPLVKRKRRFDK
jgi:ribosomal protein S10